MLGKARIDHIRQVAHSYIKKYDLKEPPIPIEAIIRSERLTIAPMHWGKNGQLDGLLVRNKRVIAVNVEKPLRRQRFSLAHELGHYALNHDYLKQQGSEVDIDHPPLYAHRQNNQLEVEANEFANELLVPRELLLNLIPKPESGSKDLEEQFRNTPFAKLTKEVGKQQRLDATQLANLFEVSKEVIFIALTKHNLV